MRTILTVVAVIIVMAVASCTPKSASSYNTGFKTRAVILDSHNTVDVIEGYYKYKVKYIKYDVVDYTLSRNLYDQGDTVLVNDNYYGYQISN